MENKISLSKKLGEMEKFFIYAPILLITLFVSQQADRDSYYYPISLGVGLAIMAVLSIALNKIKVNRKEIL